MSDVPKSFLTRTTGRVLLAALLVVVGSAFVVRAADLVSGAEPSSSPSDSLTAEATPTATPTDTPTPSPTATPLPTFKLNGGGAKNIVIALNQTDGRFLVRGRIDLNQVGGAPRLAPVNFAYARGMLCDGCNTLAVAAQIVLYKRGGGSVVATPQNSAVAVNAGCNNCFTGAWAIQFFLPVEDLNNVPYDVDEAVRALDAEIRGIEQDAAQGTITLQQALDRLNGTSEEKIDGLLEKFRDIGAQLNKQQQVESAPDSATPYPSPPPEETGSPAPSESPAEPTPTDTATP